MTEPDTSATLRPLALGERLFERPWQFLKSAPALEFLPPADRVEIAFAGRSNVGKSSLINALLRHNGLARTSNTPGRTQELNFFLADDVPLYLVDMPGYGFAKAPKEKVEAWTALVSDYLKGRPTLARVLPADRLAPRPEAARPDHHGHARRRGGLLPGGPDQGRQDQPARARRR